MKNNLCSSHVWGILLNIRENMTYDEFNELYDVLNYIFYEHQIKSIPKLFGDIDSEYKTKVKRFI